MRLFVAPRTAVGAAPARWRCWPAALPGARWVPAENYHLTLRFIGETPAHRAEEIDHALAALRAPRLRADAGRRRHVRQGRPQPPRCGRAWSATRRSTICRAKIETALQRIGLEPERRRFPPHVTLARLDNVPEAKLAAFVQAHNLFRAEPVPVEHFTLFSSRSARSRRSIRRRWSMRWRELLSGHHERPLVSHAEMPVQHLGGGAHRGGGQLLDDVAVVEDVDAVGQADRGLRRSAPPPRSSARLGELRGRSPSRSRTMIGASPSNGSSSRMILGSRTSARAIASICCSPPERSVPRLRRRSSRRGNIAQMRVERPARLARSGRRGPGSPRR